MTNPVFVFVFGSNAAGRHGNGAALWARHHRGAIYGCGEGHQGNSYAIPTKDAQLRTLPLDVVKLHVDSFLAWDKAKVESIINRYVRRDARLRAKIARLDEHRANTLPPPKV